MIMDDHGSWMIMDDLRSPSNVLKNILHPSGSDLRLASFFSQINAVTEATAKAPGSLNKSTNLAPVAPVQVIP